MPPPFNELWEALKTDFGLGDEDLFMVGASILMSSTFLGPFPEQIAEYTGFDLGKVREIAARFKEGGIWTENDKVSVSWYGLFDGDNREEATTDFICDVLVGLGKMSRHIEEEETHG